MVERRVGTAVYWHRLSPLLALFRLTTEDGSRFPEYKAGQYVALRREGCNLTKKAVDAEGKVHYVPDVDEAGNPRRGPVTHSYSISSAPFETARDGTLEFYIVLEVGENEFPGRLTESLFRLDPQGDNKVTYMDRITGDFTLDKRAAGARSVVFVGTGTGLAPFASMIKQLHHEGQGGTIDSGVRYTLFHANRSREELAYHEQLLEIEAAKRFDFAYVASISRPTPRDVGDPYLGIGRANNLLRSVLGMPLKEQEDLEHALAGGGDAAAARTSLDRAVKPRLPRDLDRAALRARLEPSETVILTCGNASSMADIKRIADANGFRFEKEDWKFSMATKL